MGDNTHSIPANHREIRSPIYGCTDSGLSYEIETKVVNTRITSNEFAKRMMELRIQAAADARQQGMGIGRFRHISAEEVESRTEIVLRVSAPNKVYRVEIEDTGNGSYYARKYYRCGSLREVAQRVMQDIDEGRGMDMRVQERPRMAVGGYSM